MKKFICILLSFVVLLSAFAVPTAAATEEQVLQPYYDRIENEENNEFQIQTFNASATSTDKEILIRRGIFSKNNGKYTSVSGTSIFSSNLNSTATYTISNSYNVNTTKEYYQFYNISYQDGTALATAGNDINLVITKFWDYFYLDPNTYNFDLSKIKSITCGYLNKDGTTVSLDKSCVYLKEGTVDGYYSLNFKVPYQEEDIYLLWVRVYFDLDTMCSVVPTDYAYTMINGTVSLDVSKGDKATGLLEGILEGIHEIWDWITNFFSNLGNYFLELLNGISDVIDNLKNALNEKLESVKNSITAKIGLIQLWLTNLGNNILDGLKELFIPQEDYFTGAVEELKILIDSKLGILKVPFVILTDGLNAYLNIGTSDGTISFPGWTILDVTVIPPFNFELKYMINSVNLEISTIVGFDVWGLYLTAVDVICIVAFLNLCKKKYDKIITAMPSE